MAGSLGAPATLLVSGTMTVGGMAVALLVPVAAVAIVGMAIAALGASFVVPVVVEPRRSPRGSVLPVAPPRTS